MKAQEKPVSLRYKTKEPASLIPTCGYCIPKDVIQLIFRKLPPDELLKIASVCKLWNQIASRNALWNSYHLKGLFPKATFIDKSVWESHVDVEKYQLDMEEKGRPCCDKQDYIDIKRMESQVEAGKGITIMTLFRGDKLNNVRDFVGSPIKGNPTAFQYFANSIVEECGDVKLTETMTVVMTNAIFKGSRSKSIKEMKKIAGDLKCEVPEILAVTNLAVMWFIMSPPEALVRLFSDNPLTYTLCVDKKKDESTGEIVEVISHFGGFDPTGPNVCYYYRDVDYENVGVGGLKRLKKVIDPSPNFPVSP